MNFVDLLPHSVDYNAESSSTIYLQGLPNRVPFDKLSSS